MVDIIVIYCNAIRLYC